MWMDACHQVSVCLCPDVQHLFCALLPLGGVQSSFILCSAEVQHQVSRSECSALDFLQLSTGLAASALTLLLTWRLIDKTVLSIQRKADDFLLGAKIGA